MDKKKSIALVAIVVIIIISLMSIIELNSLNGTISELQQEKQSLQNQANSKQSELSSLNAQILDVNSEIDQVKLDMGEAKSEIEKLESGNSYELHDPDYWEVETFISQDTTDEKNYYDESFNCADYAQEVNNNAEELGIRCAFVLINLSGPVGHAIVAFNVTNRGIIYYEAMNDRKPNLQVGKDYWADCMPIQSGYYYPADPDNIILDFTLYW